MGTSEDIGKKIFPWGWGHWLNFMVLLFKSQPFPWLGGGEFTLTCAFKHLQNVRFCALFRLKFFIILFLFYHIFGDIH